MERLFGQVSKDSISKIPAWINCFRLQVEDVFEKGARSFIFLTVPPTNRAPLILEQGQTSVDLITSALADYNAQLTENVRAFQQKHPDLDEVTVFDTQPIFNTLLDNSQTFGFVNATGFCDAYQNGTPEMTTQIAPCAPVSSYLWVIFWCELLSIYSHTTPLIPAGTCSWLNTLHPLFTIHK